MPKPTLKHLSWCQQSWARGVDLYLNKILNPTAKLQPRFCEGLCRVLSGLNAASARNIIRAILAQLIPSKGGLHFVFSHDFSDLLRSQMEATLEGQNINVSMRKNKLTNGQFKSWSDSLADDYIHRPLGEKIEVMSFYEMS